MSLFDDILSWATADLKDWQRDALRRLVQKQELDSQDIDDLYAMLKSAQGLPDEKNRQPIPLAKEHFPVNAGSIPLVTLRSIRELKNVNRIAAGQMIELEPNGITVVYGGNGSGKSGYSRVLKRACRARDLTETVHPDASDAMSTSRVPEAIFDVDIGGKVTALKWTRDVKPPDEMSTISVFDGRCARAYLDAEQDAAYLPYGLDVVENLGQKVLPALSRLLNAEIATIDTDATTFADLVGETLVGRIIASLSASSDLRKIRDLATFTNAETLRFDELNRTLTEGDPRAKAKSLRLLVQRIDGLISRIDAAAISVDDAAMAMLKTSDEEAMTASQAETLAAAAFRAGEPLLRGTGEQVWKDLLDAARRFSTEVVHPGEPFPHLQAGARCLLCQQPLDQSAAKRMERFEDYVKQDTAKVASEKRETLKNAVEKLKAALLGFGLDAAITEEIRQLDANLHKEIWDYEEQVSKRRTWLLEAARDHAWDHPPLIFPDPRPRMRDLSAALTTQAVDLEKASDVKQKQLLESERAELLARQNLSLRLKAVIALIERMRTKDVLTKCRNDLRTKPISDKAREFASQAVTTALTHALNTEFQALGVGRIKVRLGERVEQGRMKHKLLLDLPVTKPLNEILSEGEQRAIAIGSFLAELHLAGHKGGIVFDDPVSSLDHHWRKKVACRLVEEANIRQVIVFTHDTVFLGELSDAIERQRVNHLMHHLEYMNGFPGYVYEGLPWEHQSYKERLDKHEKEQKALERDWPLYPNANDRERMRHQYNLLRATIERVIQDVVFNGVVQRYRDWVNVGNLHSVAGLTMSECSEIDRLHTACCNVVDAHDPSSAKIGTLPDAVQLGKDIRDLKAVIDVVKARRKP